MTMKASNRMFSAAVRNQAQAPELELYIFDQIGEDWTGQGITPQNIVDALKEAGPVGKITLHINSPGGASFDGVAIHSVIRAQKVPVTVVVDGLAASAAFTVAMSGDEIFVAEGAMMMLHNAWSLAIGNAQALRTEAELLDKVSATMRDLYVKRSGLSASTVASLMDAETWMGPDECVKYGFATSKLETSPSKVAKAAAITARFDQILAKFYSRVPEAVIAAAAKETKRVEDAGNYRARLRIREIAARG